MINKGRGGSLTGPGLITQAIPSLYYAHWLSLYGKKNPTEPVEGD